MINNKIRLNLVCRFIIIVVTIVSCKEKSCSHFEMKGGSVQLFSLYENDYPDLEVKEFNKNSPIFGFELDLDFNCTCEKNCLELNMPFTDTLVEIKAFLKHSTQDFPKMEKDSTDLDRFFLSQAKLFKHKPRVFRKDKEGKELEVDDYFDSSLDKIVNEYNKSDSEINKSSFDRKIYFYFDSRNFFPDSNFDAVSLILEFKNKTLYITSIE